MFHISVWGSGTLFLFLRGDVTEFWAQIMKLIPKFMYQPETLRFLIAFLSDPKVNKNIKLFITVPYVFAKFLSGLSAKYKVNDCSLMNSLDQPGNGQKCQSNG